MKKYLGLLAALMCLIFSKQALAQEITYAKQEEFDIPEMSEEIRALSEEQTGTDAAHGEKKELYRLLKKDAALADYNEKTVPAAYDPRIENQVTPVRDQSSNTCWAFSSLGAGEMSLVQKGLADPAGLDLSEAHLAYFFYHSIEDPLGNTKGDGNHNISRQDFIAVGSNTIFSTFALANWVGAADESSAPFEDLETNTQYQDSLAYADAAHLQNAYWINFKDVDAIHVTKQMIKQYGGAAINFYWNWIYYNEKNDAYYFPLDPDKANNHSVTIVGWDDHYPKENFEEGCQPEEDGAWIIKNSYGEDWGENGYFYLSYEDSAVNTSNTNANRARAYIFDFELADNYDYNYQYDGSAGAYNATNPDSPLTKIPSGGSIANVFSVQSRGLSYEETLKAVSFALFDTAVSYSIQIYKNPVNASDPASGTPAFLLPVTGSTSYAGYYTIPLPDAVSLAGGDVFSVVITLEKESGGDINFFVDKTYQNGNWVSFTNQVNKGESFRKMNENWEDMASNGVTARIKAFTDAEGTASADFNEKPALSDTSPKREDGESVDLSAELTPSHTVFEANGDSVTQASPSSPTKSANTADISGEKAGFWIVVMLFGIVLLRLGKRAVL